MSTVNIPGPFRGGTLQFKTTFYDVDGEITQPIGAIINLVYPDADGAEQNATLVMDPPLGDAVEWIALWDTRDVGPGVVFWSIHTTGAGIPFAVEDGRFSMAANVANLPTF